MKNKKLIYILIPVNFILWGYIAYSILFHKNSSTELINSESGTKLEAKTIANDTFSLILNYRDPFLINFASKKNKSEITLKNKPVLSEFKINKRLTASDENWPLVDFHGTIINSTTKKSTSLVSINGVNHIMKLGDQHDSVKLVQVFKDSVLLEFMKKKKVFKK